MIRTMVPSRTTKQYICHGLETEFKPATERTLYRIIDVCAESRQKSLQGLDILFLNGRGTVVRVGRTCDYGA